MGKESSDAQGVLMNDTLLCQAIALSVIPDHTTTMDLKTTVFRLVLQKKNQEIYLEL